MEEEEVEWTWMLSTDGSANSQGLRIGIVLEALFGLRIEAAHRLDFVATNNKVEYEAYIYGLELPGHLGVKRLKARGDNTLVTRQVEGTYEAKDSRMKKYFDKAQKLTAKFEQFDITQVLRELNQKANKLAKDASVGEYTRKSKLTIQSMMEDLEVSSSSVVFHTQPKAEQFEKESWMDLIIKYLVDGIEPMDKDKARGLRLKAATYCMIDGKLYRKSFSGPYLRCLKPDEVVKLMEEIHEGLCGNHA